MLPPAFLLVAAGAFLAFGVIGNTPVIAAESASPSVATLRGQLSSALDRSDLPAAWVASRAWLGAAPSDPAARLAQAELYLKLNAPAAAIDAAGQGIELLTDATRGIERPLQAIKAHAHALLGEPAPAWVAFSRVAAPSAPDQARDPLTITARRARWDVYAQLAGADAYTRYLSKLVAAAAAPGAPVAAQLRLARWLNFIGNPKGARATLRAAVAARPDSRELKAALIEFALAAAIADLEEDPREELALLAADPSLDPLAQALFAVLRPSGAIDPAPVAPRDYPAFVDNLTSSFSKRYTQLEGIVTDSTIDLERAVEASNLPGDVASLARFSEWEKQVSDTFVALVAASSAQRRLENMFRFVTSGLDEKIAAVAQATPGSPDLPALRAAAEKLKGITLPDGGSAYRPLARQAMEAIPAAVISVRAARRKAEAHAALAAAAAPAQILAATEDALAAGDLSPTVWRARFTAAHSLGDDREALASGARAFVAEWVVPNADLNRELPAATVQLLSALEEISSKAPSLLEQARTAWKAGDAGAAFALLDRALALDPALPAAWRLRAQWFEASGDTGAAALALERWWRLDDRTAWDSSAAFAVASRAGAWELLLSLAEARVASIPTDAEAHLFRACAALACSRIEIARESLTVVEVSRHRATGRLLQLITHTVAPAGEDGASAANAARALLSGPSAPRGLAEWCAYLERQKRNDAAGGSLAPDNAASNPSDLHVKWLEGRVATADYIARTRGTAEEAMARFWGALVARQPVATPETIAAVAAAANDPQLPLPLRAAARHFQRLDAKLGSPSPLRACDPIYALDTPPTAEGWGGLGQEVVVTKAVNVDALPATSPLRIRGVIGSRAAVTFENKGPEDPAARPRLWELRNLRLNSGFIFSAGPKRPRAIVDGTDLVLDPFAPGEISRAAALLTRVTPTGGSLDVLCAAVKRQTRVELWRAATVRFEREFFAATDVGGRERAVTSLAQSIGEAGEFTGATLPESTSAMIDAVLPALQRYPREVPALFAAASPPGVGIIEIWRERMPDNLKENLRKYAQSFDQADRLSRTSGNKISVETVYGFAFAYPPGSRDYAAAQTAITRGLTPAQFEAELATQRKRAAELAATAEKRRKEEEARRLEEAKHPQVYSPPPPRPRSGIINSADYTQPGWTSGSYTPTIRSAPVWAPSETYSMKVYRHNLDVQITRAVRGY